MKIFLFGIVSLLSISCSQKEISSDIQISSTPEVVVVYPTSDTLPENLLRFYVQFSKPMKAVNNLENIKLLNESGRGIQGAIFNNVYELWDNEQKQLTLILDPSRVKTGLVVNESLGRALEADKKYKLIIEKAEDIHGNQIKHPFVKAFIATKADILGPNHKNWNIKVPKSNSTSPLTIDFPQALDHQSVHNSIRLINSFGQLVSGKGEVQKHESQWCLHPIEKWTKGTYTLLINSRLEDPSGNNMNGLFDHQIGGLKSPYEGKIEEILIKIN